MSRKNVFKTCDDKLLWCAWLSFVCFVCCVCYVCCVSVVCLLCVFVWCMKRLLLTASLLRSLHRLVKPAAACQKRSRVRDRRHVVLRKLYPSNTSSSSSSATTVTPRRPRVKGSWCLRHKPSQLHRGMRAPTDAEPPLPALSFLLPLWLDKHSCCSWLEPL